MSCSVGPSLKHAVAITIRAENDIDAATLAAISTVALNTTGDETYDTVIAPGRQWQRVERIIYRPANGTTVVQFHLVAQSSAALPLARGDSVPVQIAAGGTDAIEIDLHSFGFADDLGSDGPDGDAGVSDDAGDAARPSYSALVLADNPVGYYRCDETSGTTLVDSSGLHADGVYRGTGVSFGATGALASDPDRAISMMDNGTQHQIASPSANFEFPNRQPFTLEMWISPTALPVGRFNFLSHTIPGVSGKQGYELASDRTTQALTMERWIDGVAVIASAPLIKPQVYTHVVGLYDGNEVAIYVDGSLVTKTVDARTQPNLVKGFLYSAGNAYGGQPLAGAYDEFAVYDTALSAKQIKAHYDAAK